MRAITRHILYTTTNLFLLLCLMVLFFPKAHEAAASVSIPEHPMKQGEANVVLPLNSASAILIDARSGDVLYEKNANTPMAPASITKIVTGIIALEYGRLEENVVVSRNARNVDGTRIFLAEGEQKKLEDLIYGLLMNSGNDAAVAIAEHIDGSVQAFSQRMNAFAASVGANHTHFTNPSGLYEKEHITTAADMAKIAAYAMKNEKFRNIVGTRVKPWEGKEWKSKLVNHNKLLASYQGANGIKNGFTHQSGFTLVASAERDGTELIVVLMKADSDRQIYKDAATLLDYGFEHYKTVPVLQRGATISGSNGKYHTNGTVYASIPRNDTYRVQVNAQDVLVVETSSGKVRQYPDALVRDIQANASDKQMSDAGKDRKYSFPEFLMLFFWWLMILFMSWVIVLFIRKKRGDRKSV